MPKATATHKIVATVGKYNDRTTGEEKKRYLTVGTAFTDDQGRISLKLEAMPVTPEWSGWLSLYPLDEDRERHPVTRTGARKYPGNGRSEAPPSRTTQPTNDDDDLTF